ncbi:hypothetical protein [Synechococcus sp. GFB01]|uniref:hypothetical protein n=1 Tax=Synechococcus sp. GFB01 TaxID=1662190 RepID=UPI000A83EB22|nr:hypothetical protein [Synechococcus sp. GFB01]
MDVSNASSQSVPLFKARGSRLLLYFVEACGYGREHRREADRAGSVTEPFRHPCVARYDSPEVEWPMTIRWRLERQIQARWLQGAALAV